MISLQRILNRFLPVTTIHVDDGEVVFQRETDEARAEPLIRISDDGKIIELGKSAATAAGGRLVRLFGEDGSTDDAAIRAFCRYHLMVTSGGSLLRTRVTLVEPTFRKAFGPGASSAFQRVLRADGFQAEIALIV